MLNALDSSNLDRSASIAIDANILLSMQCINETEFTLAEAISHFLTSKFNL